MSWKILCKKTTEMGNYFCKMHVLVNMASEADKVLAELDHVGPEITHLYSLPQSGESGAARLVRTAVKALHPRGCEQSGAAADFITDLSNQNILLKLVPYKGNRFNILFYDAGAVYYHHKHIQQFIYLVCQHPTDS